MRKLTYNLITLFVIIAASLNSYSALAQAVKNDEVKIHDFVSDMGNKIIEIAGNKSLLEKDRVKQIINLTDSVIDPDWIARFALGRNYITATEAEKIRFTKLYREFMIDTYGPKFKRYNGKKFTVNSVENLDSFYLVKCEFLPQDSNVPIEVDFRVKKRNDKILVIDLITEGISLIEAQRSEFKSAIARDGMDKFLDNLEQKVNKLKSEFSYLDKDRNV
jgi:phospholipid transport system substrate-binding protein